MTALHAVLLVVVAFAGTATVAVRDPVRQAIVSGAYGLAMTALFLAFAAPDVALSMAVISSLAMPVMLLLALGRMRADEREGGGGEEDDG